MGTAATGRRQGIEPIHELMVYLSSLIDPTSATHADTTAHFAAAMGMTIEEYTAWHQQQSANGWQGWQDSTDFSGFDRDQALSAAASFGDANFDRAFEIVVASEGGYVDHPNDRGGETFMGIARNFNPEIWEQYGDEFRSGNPSPEALNAIKQVYYEDYWQSVNGIENLSEASALVAFDAAVNHGPGYANKLVAQAHDNPEAMLDERMDYYHSIVARNPSQRVFLNGWENRLSNLQDDIVQMARTSSTGITVGDDAAATVEAGGSFARAADAGGPQPDTVDHGQGQRQTQTFQFT